MTCANHWCLLSEVVARWLVDAPCSLDLQLETSWMVAGVRQPECYVVGVWLGNQVSCSSLYISTNSRFSIHVMRFLAIGWHGCHGVGRCCWV